MSFIINNVDGKLYSAFKVRNKSTGNFTCWGNYSWLERRTGKMYETLRGARQAIVANAVNAAGRDDYEIVEVTILESHGITKVYQYNKEEEETTEGV